MIDFTEYYEKNFETLVQKFLSKQKDIFEAFALSEFEDYKQEYIDHTCDLYKDYDYEKDPDITGSNQENFCN